MPNIEDNDLDVWGVYFSAPHKTPWCLDASKLLWHSRRPHPLRAALGSMACHQVGSRLETLGLG